MAERLRTGSAWLAVTISALSICAWADTVREPMDASTAAVYRNGRLLMLECLPPAGPSAETFLRKYLAEGVDWEPFATKGGVAIRFDLLNRTTQRNVLLAIFKRDYVDKDGWHHVVLYTGRDQELLWSLCEWLTGKGTTHDRIVQINELKTSTLYEGQEVLFPRDMLLEVMRELTPERMPALPPEPEEEPEVDLREVARELEYVERKGKQYAVYRLQPGEALYTAVVVRFTDYRVNADILAACDTLSEESEIKDVHSMKPGTPIYIPVDMLSDRFKPESNPDRKEYEEILAEASRLRGQVRSKDLQGVVVILDPGHGGNDSGALTVNSTFSLYEDEINYDIVCRIKQILETTTQAKVYVTMLDPKQKYVPSQSERFTYDKDEAVLVTPNFVNHDVKVGLNLRWYLANSIYNKELKNGVDPRKVIFTSVHCDALFNDKLRGAMVYLPGAAHRNGVERPKPTRTYDRYAEVREQPEAKSTSQERRRDEALSRNFAELLLEELGKARIKRHSVGDPIRNVIRQSGGVEYVPAVLRNTLVPTKVLVETANLTNPTDAKWLSQPWWRQRFAEAYVEALKRYYQ